MNRNVHCVFSQKILVAELVTVFLKKKGINYRNNIFLPLYFQFNKITNLKA